jgi:hypothetical protein
LSSRSIDTFRSTPFQNAASWLFAQRPKAANAAGTDTFSQPGGSWSVDMRALLKHADASAGSSFSVYETCFDNSRASADSAELQQVCSEAVRSRTRNVCTSKASSKAETCLQQVCSEAVRSRTRNVCTSKASSKAETCLQQVCSEAVRSRTRNVCTSKASSKAETCLQQVCSEAVRSRTRGCAQRPV